VPEDFVTPEMRRAAKAVNFGIVYGISDFSLAQDIGTTKAKAKQYIEGYLDLYSGVKNYMTDVVEKARADGFVTTLMGRRRYLPELSSSNFLMRSFGERAAMNAPIQGSAADIIKIAMVGTYNTLKAGGFKAKLILQVHDELIIEAPENEKDAVIKLLSQQMEGAMSLNVRLKADLQWGRSWYECK
jgi:DNA polymerase-1